MPMKFILKNNEICVQQSFDSPTVYFDHWAICDFSEDLNLQNKFIETMREKKGTLILSHTNLIEFSKASDPKHAKAAENFIEQLMPNVYMTDFDLEKAIEFEKQPKYKDQKMWPSADLPMLKLLAERSIIAGTSLSFAGFIKLSHINSDSIAKTFQASNESILTALIKQRNNPIYVEKARRSVPDKIRPKTWVIMGELMRELTIDTKSTITINDIADWQHAILSVSCCDYVLLDRKWEQRVQAMTDRAKKQKLDFKFAKCFSKRNDGLNRFLNELKAY